MSNYFLDASALVKRYAAESGSAWVLSITEQQHPPLTFVASDDDLLAAARAEGLPVDNPLDHDSAEPGA